MPPAPPTSGRPLVLMHALRLAEGLHGHLGGNFYHVQHLAKAIHATSDVRLIVLTDEGSHGALAESSPELELLPARARGSGVLAADRQVLEACEHLRPDLYHRPTGQLPFSRLPCRTVVSIADLNFRTLPMRWTRRLYKEVSYRWTVRRADRITCVSEFTRSEVIRHLHVSPQRLSVVPHGTIELAPAHQGLADTVEGPFWLTFGHQEHKNVETVLRALELRRGQSGTFREKVVVVGRSAHIDQVLRPMVAAMGLTDAVLFPGRVDEPSLHGLYRRAIGLLFLSRYEGFGLPVLEAMGSGCPVVSSNACSLPEVVGDAAIVLPPDDSAGVCEAMRRLTSEPELREQLVTRGRARAREFTWARAAHQTVSIYRTLLTEKTSLSA